MADAATIFQYLGNSDKYELTDEGAANADVIDNGKGIVASDALAIQAVDAKTIKQSQFPMTSDEYNDAIG